MSAFTHALSTNNYGPAKFIVDASAANGTHTTIAAALTSASSGDTIFIRPGTYTENLTLKAGVNLTAYGSDSSLNQTGKVIISGKATFTAAGTVTISGIQLQTNSDFLLAVTGSAASIVNLVNCNLNCTNNTGISFTTSSGSAAIALNRCTGDLGTTGIGLFASSSAGALSLSYSLFTNTGASSTANTISAGTFNLSWSSLKNPVTSSSTGAIAFTYASVDSSAQNVTAVTCGGSGNGAVTGSQFLSGSASAISISQTMSLSGSVISSSNTNAITGAGTINYGGLIFTGTSSNINTTTQTLFNRGPSATFGSSNSGNTNTLTVTNSSNTATSSANILSTVGGGTAADPTFQATISGVTTFTFGLDNSASDAFVIAASTALGTTNVMSVATSGEINYPLQTAFAAFKSSPTNNVTGNSTIYTFVCDTEIFDQNADYNNGTGVFTAPVTGRYNLSATCVLTGCTINTKTVVNLATSNRIWTNSTQRGASNVNNACECNALVDMDAADTCTTTVIGIGETADTDDVYGGATDPNTFFTGYLAC